MCCPRGVTEEWYQKHPRDYARHPAMFLGQVSTDDVQADGCAAKLYHEAMQMHNATSELVRHWAFEPWTCFTAYWPFNNLQHLIPLDEQRCYAIGQKEDPAAAKAAGGDDPYAKFCNSPRFRSMNHTTGFASAVEPLVRFLMKVLWLNNIK